MNWYKTSKPNKFDSEMIELIDAFIDAGGKINDFRGEHDIKEWETNLGSIYYYAKTKEELMQHLKDHLERVNWMANVKKQWTKPIVRM